MKKYIVLLISVTVLFSSCDEDFFDQVVEVDIPEHTPALAITSNLSNNDLIIWTYVTSSVGVLEPDNPPEITDATVELFKNGELLYTLPYIDQGLYAWEATEPLGDETAEYELRVAKSGFESVSAVQTMPKQIDIINATFEKDGGLDGDGERVDEVTVVFQDEKDVANYYKVEGRLEFTTDNGQVINNELYFYSNDPSVAETGYGEVYLSDNIFDGEEYDLKLWDYDVYIDDSMNDPKIVVNLVNVSKARYFRETSIAAYENSEDNPFAEPAVIFDNIENGNGIFSLEAGGPPFYIEL